MSDFLSERLQNNGVVCKSVNLNGQMGDVYFRHIDAGQKAELVKGQHVRAVSGEKSTVDIDLAENYNSKSLLVFYSVVNPDGTRYFKKLADVKAIDARIMESLYLAADEVNKPEFIEDDAGKS